MSKVVKLKEIGHSCKRFCSVCNPVKALQNLALKALKRRRKIKITEL